MAITIQITPETEKTLREEARQRGLDIENFITRLIEQHLPTKKTTDSRESELMQKINLGFSKDFWDAYKLLIKKRQAEKITEEEFSMLTDMTDQLEVANVERMKNLLELSQGHKVPLKELMKRLDIKPMQL